MALSSACDVAPRAELKLCACVCMHVCVCGRRYCLFAAPQAGSYLGEAVERVVAHNFTGDETEPPTGAGAAGWKGDIHDRKTDG